MELGEWILPTTPNGWPVDEFVCKAFALVPRHSWQPREKLDDKEEYNRAHIRCKWCGKVNPNAPEEFRMQIYLKGDNEHP